MPLTSSALWTRTVAVGVIAVASVIGNVSQSAAEQRLGATTSPVAMLAPSDPLNAWTATGSMLMGDPLSGFGYSRFDTPESAVENVIAPPLSETAEIAATNEYAQVVPAIYSWDPDVRFVFYRHVSKWM